MNVCEAGLLEDEFERALRIPLKVVIASEATDETTLTAGERARYEVLRAAAVQEAWLRGRTALKELLRCFGSADDTSALIFPNRWCSLSHSGTYAVAIGTASRTLSGIGIDLEIEQVPHPESARLFLTREERDWLATVAPSVRARELQRLWTVKEAAFKSDPRNTHTWLADYRLEDPGSRRGRAVVVHDGGSSQIGYVCVELASGAVSVAVLPAQGDLR